MQVYPDDDFIGVEEKDQSVSIETEKNFNFTPIILAAMAALIFLLSRKRK